MNTTLLWILQGLGEFLKAATAPTLAIVAGYIAWQQKNIANEQKETAKRVADLNAAKIKLDLYERRFAVFKATVDFLETALRARSLTMNECNTFRRVAQQAPFLFETDLGDLLIEILRRVSVMATAHDMLDDKDLGTDVRIKLASDMMTEFHWLEEQHAELALKFRPYLDFQKSL